MSTEEERTYWLDDSRNVDKVVRGLYALCVFLVLLDFLPYKHEVHYGVENWIGFYAFYGLVGCVALVLIAKGLRVILHREEDYYD